MLHERAEEARAAVLERFPEGFEELERPDAIELAVYTDAAGEERLRGAFPGADVASTRVERDWEERWRRFHRPVRVGRVWVGPPWEAPPPEAIAVVIEPGRAFGTGAHPTTRLCGELLQELPRGSLLDVGCGSGVLAVAAALLGFEPVTAVDVADEAVEATGANAERNGVSVTAIRVDARTEALPPAATAVANIALAVVEEVAPRLRCERLVTSGYLAGQRPNVPGYRPRARRELDGWAADLFERA